MENEIKAKVFAQYLGQKIMLDNHDIFTGFYCEGAIIKHLENGAIGTPKLILKPLSAITDEDCKDLFLLIYPEYHGGDDPNLIWSAKQLLKPEYPLSFEKGSIISQYLQSKGYDLPQYLLGGKTLQEAGLAIYQNQ